MLWTQVSRDHGLFAIPSASLAASLYCLDNYSSFKGVQIFKDFYGIFSVGNESRGLGKFTFFCNCHFSYDPDTPTETSFGLVPTIADNLQY